MASQVAIITGGDTFRSVFTSNGRLDSVFANAGVIERTNFFAASESDEPPPKPDLRVLDIDLKSVVLTSYLAQHYFRRSPGHGKGAILVITASCGGGGGVYPSWSVPLYSAAKHRRQDHDQKDGDSDFLVDAMGVSVPSEKAYGHAVEISGTSFYFR
ncbi:hypothetical protein ASPWEDRAFT_32866 [Aspergillus wentii DTO 134E9]|uniref:Uncharacterized protein n=1 Tax=Aspergillus wentii DTO 134E9 TaxID=1073089 RepID=A0A1L9R724_ASPWE|nr:uncharacterized protein ASPWEDRAFT_32866 [Aspergillus wentii DTO 134E9]OJJ30709.1 hypothetical protein ASPWEDRAFT_32866 [Aspergillus wentii DTO 134E9]